MYVYTHACNETISGSGKSQVVESGTLEICFSSDYRRPNNRSIEIKIKDQEHRGSGVRGGQVNWYEREAAVRLTDRDINQLLNFLSENHLLTAEISCAFDQ